MINGFHVLMYSTNAAADRAFFRDILKWPFVQDEGSSSAEEWLIFKLPSGEIGVHPAAPDQQPTDTPVTTLHLMCDDIERTIADLEAVGTEFVSEFEDRGYGLAVDIRLPGGSLLGLYQPRHEVAHSLSR